MNYWPEVSRAVSVFLGSAVPSWQRILVLSLPLMIYGILAASLAAWLRQRQGWRTAYTRKVFHFLIFSLAGLLQVMLGLSAVTLFGGWVTLIVLYSVVKGDGFGLYEALARESDFPRRTLFVLIPLLTTALGGIAANFFFQPVAYVGYIAGGWGDAVGEPVGSHFGRHRYRVPGFGGITATRSLEGSAAILLAAGLGIAAILWLNGYTSHEIVKVAIAGSLATALVEAISHHGTDNFTVQVAAAGVAWWLLKG